MGFDEIRSIEDWFSYAPPKKGELQWKDKRSAKELARSWFRNNVPKPPDELVSLLEAKFGAGITFDEAKPECIIELDDFAGEHRNCDLVVLCKAGAKRMVINVEAKADEPFGDLIGEYFDRKTGWLFSGDLIRARASVWPSASGSTPSGRRFELPTDDRRVEGPCALLPTST